MDNTKKLKIAYFGGEPVGVPVLEELEKAGIIPNLIVCSPDRPVGRKQILTPPPVKLWAEERNIETFQPDNFAEKSGIGPLISEEWDLFIVVAYTKFLPKWLIELPKHKTLNVHPSLLPLLRGASPIRSAILHNMQETGVTIMQVDEKMDHGPIIAQQQISIPDEQWPIAGNELDTLLAQAGGQLLAETIPEWINGNITPREQSHEDATLCGKIEKADGELTIDPYNLPAGTEAYAAFLKIQAYDGWPGTFFIHEGKRIKIIAASLTDNHLTISRIIPEGKKETDFHTYF